MIGLDMTRSFSSSLINFGKGLSPCSMSGTDWPKAAREKAMVAKAASKEIDFIFYLWKGLVGHRIPDCLPERQSTSKNKSKNDFLRTTRPAQQKRLALRPREMRHWLH